MTLNTPIFAQNSSYSAADFRELIQLFPGTGPVNDGDLKVSQRGAGVNMSVDVAAGLAVIENAVASRGRYLCRNTAVVNVPLDASPGVGNNRIDLIVASVTDTEYSDPSDAWIITKKTGTPAPSPTAPTLDAGSILLATVSVGAGVSSISNGNITDARTYAGGLTYTNRLPATAVNGQVVVSSSGVPSFRAAGTWVKPVLGSQFKAASAVVTRDLPNVNTLAAFGSVASATVIAGPVNVMASFTGDAYYTGGSSARGTVAVEISLDGGATWNRGETCSGTTENIATGTDPDATIAASHARSGTSTGAVRVRLVAARDGAVFWYLAGGISVMVTPG